MRVVAFAHSGSVSIHSIVSMQHVAIVGAGLSGLAVAFRLYQLTTGVRITVLESRDRTGGNIATLSREGFRVEAGPNGFLDSKPGMLKLCRDVGLGHRLIAASEGSRKNRFVFLDGKVQKLPGSPLGILSTGLLSVSGKIALLREPFRAKPRAAVEESVAAFARRRFGREAADVFVDALVTGIHAGDPEALSVAAAFPRLVQMEAASGSVLRGFLAAAKLKKAEAHARGEKPAPTRMWSFDDGLQVLVDALRSLIDSSIHTGVSVKSLVPTSRGVHPHGYAVHGDGTDVWPADAVVLACPPHEQARMLAEHFPAVSLPLSQIPSNRVAVVALGYRREDAPNAPDGFGYIAPQNTKRDVLGVQWCSEIFPDRAPPGYVLWRVLCGGVSRPDVFERDDATLLRTCHEEMKLAMNVRGEPVFHEIVRWPRAIPQYNLGHLDRVARTEAALPPGLFLAGNGLHGIAMNDVAERAEAVARQVGQYLAIDSQSDRKTDCPPAGPMG